jgi:SAM-dependent methyltransferase
MNRERIPKAWRQGVRKTLPFLFGYFDGGRRMVQGPPIRELLGKATQSQKPRRVLNAGCGGGLYSSLLNTANGAVELVELDIENVPSPQRDGSKYYFAIASLTAIPMRDNLFDIVLCSEVLEHISDDAMAMDELRRVMAPGGHLLVTVPTPPAPFDPHHIREGYTSEELVDAFESRGLHIVEVRFCMHGFFRLLYLLHSKLGFLPNLVIRALSWADYNFPVGSPWDLLMLAQSPALVKSPVEAECTNAIELNSKRTDA